MRLKTFTARDMKAAMLQIRKDLGEEAIIISTTRDNGVVSVTAAIDSEVVELTDSISESAVTHSRPTSKNTHKANTDGGLMGQLEALLDFHSIPENVMNALLDTASMVDAPQQGGEADLEVLLGRILHANFRFLPLPLTRSGFKAMLIGPAGMGKTMAIAKMAAQCVMDQKQLRVITCDTNRAGGVAQLQAFTDILNIDLHVAESGEELHDFVAQTDDHTSLLIDCFGCNPFEQSQLDDLADFLPEDSSVERILTLSAGGDASEAADIMDALSFVKAKRLIMTRCDMTRRFGNVLTAAHNADLAFCNASHSDRVVGEFSPMGNKRLSQFMMAYRK